MEFNNVSVRRRASEVPVQCAAEWHYGCDQQHTNMKGRRHEQTTEEAINITQPPANLSRRTQLRRDTHNMYANPIKKHVLY